MMTHPKRPRDPNQLAKSTVGPNSSSVPRQLAAPPLPLMVPELRV
jgi:hypothetical protein